MIFDSEKLVMFSDTLGELIQGLIPNYLKMDEDEKMRVRFGFMLELRGNLQSKLLLKESMHRGLTEEETHLFNESDFFAFPHIEKWSSPIPLLVVEEGYAPYAKPPLPIDVGEGVIYLLSSSTERVFLSSLVDAKEISVLDCKAPNGFIFTRE